MSLRFGYDDEFNGVRLTGKETPNEKRKEEQKLFNELHRYVDESFLPFVASVNDADVELHGAHLLIGEDGLGNIGLTYRVTTRRKSEWRRKVSVHILDPAHPRGSFEFVFTFIFRGTFEEYCRHTGIMDELALSVRLRQGGPQPAL